MKKIIIMVAFCLLGISLFAQSGDDSGEALRNAAGSGNLDKVKTLIESGADVNAYDNMEDYSSSPLMMASGNGHIDIVKLLIENGANVNFRSGGTALMSASGNGHIDIVKLLIENGANVNAGRNSYGGGNAMVSAAQNNHYDVLKILVQNGANVNAIENELRYTALHFILSDDDDDNFDIVKFLIDNGAGVNMNQGIPSPLILASSKGNIEIIKLLLDAGIDVNSTEYDGETALMKASTKGYTDIVQLLIENGADVNLKDDDGWTALIRTSSNGHIDIVKFLIDKGADVNASNEYGYTALMYASRKGHTDTVKELIKEDADLNVKNRYTALMYASENGYTEIVKLLIKAGADLNVKDEVQENALFLATEKVHTEIVKLLIDAGADLNVQNDDGLTSLMRASVGLAPGTIGPNHMAIVELLLNAEVDVTIKDSLDKYGRTALNLASRRGHTAIINLLTEAEQGFYTLIGTDYNYYKVPYVGETSVLTKIIGNEKNTIIEKYNFPATVNDFLDDGSSITGNLASVYREDIPNKNGKTALSVYRLMYTLSGSDSNGMTKLSFIEGEGIERQSYGQTIYTLNWSKTKAELFSRDIYFGNQDLSDSNSLSGVIGNNAYFKVIGNTVISVLYTLQSSTNQKDYNHEAIIYRNKIADIQDKTELCKVETPFPLIDKNNPYRYTIQNALDGNPATSFVEDTKDDLMSIRFDFTQDYTFTGISIINGYAQNESLYYDNNRGKSISFPEISTDYEHNYTLDGNILTHQEFTFENSIIQSSATIDVTEIYAGTKYTDTCLAELDIKTDEYGWVFSEAKDDNTKTMIITLLIIIPLLGVIGIVFVIVRKKRKGTQKNIKPHKE